VGNDRSNNVDKNKARAETNYECWTMTLGKFRIVLFALSVFLNLDSGVFKDIVVNLEVLFLKWFGSLVEIVL